MNSVVRLLLSLLQSSLLLSGEQSILKLPNLFQNNLFKQFIQNIVALTLLKLMIEKGRISAYPICYDKAEQV